MSIKYYHLAKNEEPPDEFCAVRDVGGEPSEYTFYVSDVGNAKLRELVRELYNEYRYLRMRFHRIYVQHEERMRIIEQHMRELGFKVN